MIKRFIILSILLLVSVTSHSQTMKGDNEIYISDPIEPINRWVWDFNYYVLDAYIYKPVTKIYIDWVPEIGRDALYNAALNLGEPSNIVNNLLQLQIKGAKNSLFRFIFNSTFGVFGLFDVASLGGVKRQNESFGNTLGAWGVPHGPYLMLPFIGPRSSRNLIGNIVDSSYFPNSNLTLWQSGVVWGINGLTIRGSFLGQEILLDQSLDPYTFVKGAYIQSVIFNSNQNSGKIEDFDELKRESLQQEIDKDLSGFLDEID